MRHLVIGASGFAQEVAWTLREHARAESRTIELCFFDDRVPRGVLTSGLGSVLGTLDDVASHVVPGATELVLGIGAPRAKAAVTARLAALGLPWTTVVHPTALIGPNTTIGTGSYVGAGSILTVSARVGKFVTINLHCVVAHDDVVENLVTLHPDVHLSGNVVVGEGAELGAGALVIPGARIGAYATLGAGCVAVKSLAGGRTYVGLPAHDAHAAKAPATGSAASPPRPTTQTWRSL
jgi:acetyltransferase EpsM